MSPRRSAALLALSCSLLGIARRAAATPELRAAASADFTLVRAPFFTRNLPELQAHGFLLALDVELALARTLDLRAHVPAGVFGIRQPAGAYVDESVWGNPTLSLAFVMPELARAPALTGWAELGSGLPLAEQGPVTALQKNRALEAANAAHAYLEPESFTPAIVPAFVRLGARYTAPRFAAESELSLPVLVRIREPELPPEAHSHRVGFLPSLVVTGSAPLFGPVSGSWRFRRNASSIAALQSAAPSFGRDGVPSGIAR